MRITQKTLFGNFMRDINKNRVEMARIQSDLSSGKAVRVPSQDPVAFQRSRITEENIRKEGQYQSNISSGLRQARLVQEALDESVDRLIDIKRIVVQGSTDSVDENIRQNLADEVAGIRDTIVNTLNLSYGDRFMFAGTNSGVKPFDTDDMAPGGIANNSNATPPSVLAGDGVKLDISISGEELRNTAAGDLFEVIGNIENALRDNDRESLNGLLTDIERSLEHVTTLNSRVGSNINRLEFMFEQYESFKITQKSEVSELVDTDYAQAFSELQRTQTAYEAAMAVHSTMFSNTLLNYL
jgi:flagellar hook-associated protein 3 FlgL